MAVRCAADNSAAEKDFLVSPSRASAKVSEVSSLTARAHPTVVAHACGACAGLFGGRVTNKIGCVNADDLFLRRAAFRLERVEHAQVSEFAGDAHHGYPVMPSVLLYEIPGSRDARPGMVE